MRHMELFMGRIGVIEDVRELANNNCVVNFSIAETPRIKEGDQWVDGPTIWTNVSIFGDEARNLHRSVKPGTFVMVYGERKAREYTPKDSNEKKIIQSVVAHQVGVGITKFNYVEGVGNINYAKEGYPGGTSAQGSSPAKPQPKQEVKDNPFDDDPFDDDPFDDNPFGDDDDNPFGL